MRLLNIGKICNTSRNLVKSGVTNSRQVGFAVDVTINKVIKALTTEVLEELGTIMVLELTNSKVSYL